MPPPVLEAGREVLVTDARTGAVRVNVLPKALLGLPRRGEKAASLSSFARAKRTGGPSLVSAQKTGRGQGTGAVARADRTLLGGHFERWRGLVVETRRARAHASLDAVTRLQTRVRGWQSKAQLRRLQTIRREQAAITIEAAARGRMARIRAVAAYRSARRAMGRKSIVPTGSTIISRSHADVRAAIERTRLP